MKNKMKILSFLLMVSMCLSIVSPVFAQDMDVYDVEAKQTEETMLEQSEDMQIQDYTIDQQNNPVLDAPYNYKIGFESKDDIVTDLTYRPVGVEYKYTKKYDENGKKVLETIYDEDGKPIPFDPPSEKSSSNPKWAIGEGKYGNGLVMKFYSSYINPEDNENTFAAVCQLTLPTSRVLLRDAVGGQTAVYTSFADAIYGFTSLNFWVKAEKLSDEDRTDGGKYTIKPTRSFDIFLGGYSANVTIENNEEWQYVSIPVEKFKLVSTSNAIKNIKTLEFRVNVVNENFFGVRNWPTPREEGKEFVQKPDWVDALYIDEMVFERSTPILRTTTRPSVGEDYSYYRNTNLKEITIDGYKVYDNVINAGDEEITVTLPYDFDVTSPVDRLRVEAIPECVDIPPSKTQQARSGAVTDVNFPEQLPGKGNIVVTAGSGEIRVYNINFEKSDIPITLESAINLPSALTPGYRLVTFNIKNYDSEARDATVIFVLEDKETGELQQILHDRRQIEPGTIRLISLRLNIPAQVDKYIAHVYFYDNVLNMNQIINTITLTAN